MDHENHGKLWNRLAQLAGRLWNQLVELARRMTGKIASSIMLIFLWLLFLSLGNALKSDDYSPQKANDLRSFLSYTLLYLVSWTWTNVGVLACVAAALGETSRDIQSNPRSDYRRALVRGFFAYLAVTAGYVVGQGGLSLVDVHPTINGNTSDQWVKSMSENAYARIAITVSLAGFLAGYAPNYIANWLATSRSSEVRNVVGVSETEKIVIAAEKKTAAATSPAADGAIAH